MMTIAITITTSIILKLNRLASAILFILRLFYSVYGCKYTAFWENMQIIEQNKTPQEHNLGASLWFDGAKNRLVSA
jgi:hypothetical protein